MTQVTMHDETPSQAIVKAASQTAAVTDPRGRSISLRKLNALDRMKLFELVGADNAKNEQYLGYATLAYMVAAIDGESAPRPTTKLQLEAMVQRLDDDGLEAIGNHFAEQAEALKESGDGTDALKNGSSTPS